MRLEKWHWRRVMAVALTVMAALAAATTAGARVDRAATTTRSAQPTIILGSKNFSEEYVLGELYRQALVAKGYNVTYKKSIGSTEIIHTALTSGKINMYPEYTGTDLTTIFHVANPPKTALAVYNLLKQKEAKDGNVLFTQTPFFDSDEIGVLTKNAKKYHLVNVGDLKKVPSVTIGGFPEFKTRAQGLVGLHKVYGLTNLTFKSYSTIPVYQGLKSGDLFAADVFSTDPPLASKTTYTVLKDTKHLFGFQYVAPIVSKKLADALGPKFRQTVDAVSKLLTLPAIQAMNDAVYNQKADPKDVATKFLKANHLL